MSDAPVKNISFVVKEGLLVNSDYLPSLERLHLDTLNNVMNFVGGALVSRRGRTSVVRIETEQGSLYLKRHEARPVRDLLRALRRFQRVDRNGKHEWENILILRSLGIGSVTPVACGRRRTAGQRDVMESCLITLGLDTAQPLDAYYNTVLASLPPRDRSRQKRSLIQETAHVVGKMHRRRLYHQDMHLRHFYVEPNTEGNFQLYLIDLQPLIHTWWIKHKIKDLARLYLDTLTHVSVTRADRWRFYRNYTGRRRLGISDRMLFKLVELKAQYMGRRILSSHKAPLDQPLSKAK